MMQLETERLIIREIVESDWEHIHTYTSLPEVTTHTAWGPNSEEATQDYVKYVIELQQAEPREGYELAICLKQDGTLIGGIGIHVMDTNAELGYVLNPSYQGRGYATEAARAILEFGFNTLRVHRIFAKCRPENSSSEKVMLHIGMEREGLMREHWYYKGKYHDSFLYSILEKS